MCEALMSRGRMLHSNERNIGANVCDECSVNECHTDECCRATKET